MALRTDCWGRGYASEAARAVLAYGFETMGLTDIYSMSALANGRSIGVMKRIGMKHVKDYLASGLPEDHPLRPYALYRITRAEWLMYARS
ncbi:MAG: GNAT family N-acetyltransferase [Rhodospirillaceae bacterium]